MVTFVGMKSKEEERVQCSTTTLGALTLIILFSKMLKFSEFFSFEILREKLKEKKEIFMNVLLYEKKTN
jgi:hypothetical protein